jgi:hypothetical protein
MTFRLATLALCMLTVQQALAQTQHFSASDGPVTAGYRISDNQHVEFHLFYTGQMYVCNAPDYKGTPVTAVFTFGVGEGKFPYEVNMGRSCTTPWSYMLPTTARIDFTSGLDDTDVLWELLRTQVHVLNAPVGIAFRDDQGRWDSRYGLNYQLSFREGN